jgi:hypothetical protein
VRDDGIRIKLCDQLASFLVPAQSSNHVVGKWFDPLRRILKKLKIRKHVAPLLHVFLTSKTRVSKKLH